MSLTYVDFPAPIDPLRLYFHDGVLVGVGFAGDFETLERALPRRFGEPAVPGPGDPATLERLRAYFAGDANALDAIPADPGGTPFQRRVWDELRRIPAGRTVTYAELARTVGQPTATRAVAGANARNPVPVVIPCHRVVASGGGLGGYGGGLPRKRWLLEHEAPLHEALVP
jgi:methylated-DNA-[protein]-cysteine S-methyltransferase